MKTKTLVSLFVAACTAAVGSAQTSWQAATGDYLLGSNWSAGVPTISTNVLITNGTSGTPSVANLAGTGNGLDFTLGSFDTINVLAGAQLNVGGTLIQNAGAINIIGGSGSNTVLDLNSSVTLTGAGALTLGYTGSGAGQGYIEQGVGGVVLTNQSTIQGQGIIGNGPITVNNSASGTIDANSSSGTLTMNGGPVTNAGLLEATGGGTLNLSAVNVANQSGNITAGNGSTVQLTSMTVSGGTLNNTGTGTLDISGTVGLDGQSAGPLTVNGTFTAGLGTQVNLSGTIVNNANFQVIGGSGSNAVAGFATDTTLEGSGTFNLDYSGSGAGQAYLEQTVGGVILTNKQTIEGQGVIGNGSITVMNDSVIDATTGTILLNASGGVTNSGLLEATGGGTLDINNITVGNTGFNITAGSGSTVDLTSSTIVGGTLNNNGGTLQVVNVTNLDGHSSGAVTINGPLLVGAGTQLNVTGTIQNNGSLQVIGGGGANTILGFSADTTLQGSGTVTMGYTGSGGGQAYLEQTVGGVILNVDQTIQGQGTIGNGALTVNNNATIDANTGTLLLNASGGVTNSGLLEATSGGTLNISNITVANTGFNITAATGSTVDLTSSTIVGGTLNNNGGTLQVVNESNLDGHSSGAVTINGPLLVGPGTQLNVTGTIQNNGNLQVTGGGGANTILGFSADTTLQGSGTLTMGYTGSGGGQAYLEQTVGGVILANKQTIQGLGTIGNGGLEFLNEAGGTIDANVSGGTLTVNPSGGFTNTGGLLEATNGGTLSLSSSVIDNLGGTIKVDGATSSISLVNGVTIQGGTLTSANGGSLGVPGSSITLDGSTEGTLTLSTGTTFTAGPGTGVNVLGTIQNNGNMEIVGGSGSNTILGLVTDTTLQGTGTVTLAYNGSGAGQAFIQQNTGGITLTNEQTIQGQGTIGNGGLTVVNAPGGTIDANVNGGTLTVNPSGGFTNTGGLLEATAGGILSLSSAVIDNDGGTIKVDGASSAISLQNGVTIQGGTLTSANGGSLGVPGSSITLDGSTEGALTLSTGTTFTAGPGTQTNLLGTIQNNGNMQITGGSGSNTILNLVADTTLEGTGTVTLAYNGSGAGQAFIQQNTGGITLTNEQTIQGQGTIGNGGLTVVNGAGGTIDANVNGATLTVNPTGTFENTGGLLEATNGGTLSLSNSVVNNDGGTIKVNGATSSVALVNGVTIQGGTLTSVNGGSLGVPGTSITLDGATEGALTLSTGSTFTAGPGTQTNVQGTIVDNGNIQVTGGGGSNAIVGLNSNTTLQGTGTVTLAYTGSGTGQAYIEGNSGGITLTNKTTIQGQGVIGNGNLTVDNASGGTILSNISGGALNFLNGGALTNEGTIQVNAGSSITDSFSSTTNSGSVVIGGGGASFTVNTAYNQTGGSTVIAAGGTLDASSINETGGMIRVDGTIDPQAPDHIGFGATMSGTGSVFGDITNDGTLILGDDVTHPGTLTETGNYTQDSDGVLDETITSLLNGKLDVTGNVSVDGEVDVDLLNGFTPTDGEIFQVIDYSGSISDENWSVIGSDASEWSVIYNRAGQVDLEFNRPVIVNGVPDGGSSWLLVGLGVAGLGMAARFRRRAIAL